jgi:glycine/serine hydroxymethyltransferase
MKEAEMTKIGAIIASVIREPDSNEAKERAKREVAEITVSYPMYGERLPKTASGLTGA